MSHENKSLENFVHRASECLTDHESHGDGLICFSLLETICKENRMPAPLISVVIPTCHRNDLLAKCLDCLAPGVQTLPSEQYEVIVTDDGSRSTAQQMVTESYPWVQWTEGPRRGPAANRNHGATLAQGKWLAFTDDDCLPTSGWLEAFAHATETNGENIKVYEGCTTCEAGITSPLYEAPINLNGGKLWSCNFMVDMSLFKQMDGLDEEFKFYMEDIDFRERLRVRGECVRFVAEASVDHPPRRGHNGIKKGQNFEARVQHWYKCPQPQSLFISFLKHTKHEIYELAKFQPSKDVAIAFASLIIETGYIATHLISWQQKYRSMLRH